MPKTTLLIKSDCMSEPNHLGKSKVIKKNIVTRLSIDTIDIKRHVELYNLKGNVLKNECRIILEDSSDLIVKHSYDYIDNLIKPIIVKGFKK